VVAAAGLAWYLTRGFPALLAFLGPAAVGYVYLLLLPWRIRHRRAAGPLAGLLFLMLMGGATYGMIECFPGEELPATTGFLIHGATLMAVAIRQGIRAHP
jgi:hypothetical protein